MADRARTPGTHQEGAGRKRSRDPSRQLANERGGEIIRESARLVTESREIQRQLAELGDHYSSIEQGGVATIEQGLRLLGATGGIVARLCENREELELVGAVGVPADVVDAYQRFPLTAQLPMAEAVRGERPVWVESPDEMATRFPKFASVLDRLGVRALAAVPVRHMGRVQGAFTLQFDKPRHLAPHERTQLLALGGRFARALYHSRLYFAEREARAEAERARAAAEAAERTKDAFLAIMSHELRTPLNAVIGYADLLADGVAGPLTPQQRGLLQRQRESGQQLLGVIEDVLSFARAQAGKEQVAVESFDLSTVVDQVWVVATPLAAKKDLALLSELPDTPVVLESDPQRLRHILLNLVGNAIKFTERGCVTLAVRVEGDRLVIAVRDTGRGIPSECLEYIFDAFWQVEHGEHRAFGGTGLGLSITRQFAQMLGGDVTASSVVGEGSTFTVTLPLRVPEAS
jgi:signal transduction histidine kinase